VTSLATFDAVLAAERLGAAGFRYAPADLTVEAREERWLVRLPDGKLAWLASSATGLAQLHKERRVLRLLEARCSFAAPRVLFESADGELDVRSMVPGISEPWNVYAHVRARRQIAADMGSTIGAMLGEQHSRVGAADVADWLPQRPAWPEPREWIRERLPRVVDDADLIARADSVIDAYENVAVAAADRALVHTDIGFHNLAIEAQSFTVNGIFDYDGAAWADRHHDFRYLVFDLAGYEMLDAASSVYEATVGYRIQRSRVLLYNAACAVTYLAFRAGVQPDVRWCGRTLAEDLQWSHDAIAKVLGPA
jgi:hypothetical protein